MKAIKVALLRVVSLSCDVQSRLRIEGNLEIIIFCYVLLPWRSSFNRVCKFFYRSASVWQVERSPGRWKTLNLEWSTWLEDAWSNNAGEVTLEDKEVRE